MYQALISPSLGPPHKSLGMRPEVMHYNFKSLTAHIQDLNLVVPWPQYTRQSVQLHW